MVGKPEAGASTSSGWCGRRRALGPVADSEDIRCTVAMAVAAELGISDVARNLDSLCIASGSVHH